MSKKFLYTLVLALSVCAAQNAGLVAQEAAGGIEWRAPNYTCWDYLEQRRELDEASWNSTGPEERETTLSEAKRACASAGKHVKLLSASPLNGDRLVEISPEGEEDAKACFTQEGKVLSEKLRILREIELRRESGTLSENDISWLEENNVSWFSQYKEAHRFQALKPKLGEHAAKQQQQLDKFNTSGTGRKLSGIDPEIR